MQLLQAQKISKTGSFNFNIKSNKITYTPEFATLLELRKGDSITFELFLSFIHPNDCTRIKKVIENAMESKDPYQAELCLLLKSGNSIDVLLTAEPYYRNNNPAGYIGTITDVTDQKRMREELRLSEEKFRSLLETAPEAMVITSREGEIKIINKQAENLFKYTREELIGKDIKTLLPYQGKELSEQYAHISNQQVNSNKVEISLTGSTKNGERMPVEISLSPLETASGVFITAAIRDMTEKYIAEQKLQNTNTQLEEANNALLKANEELEAFTYSVSHDLKAPLRIINGYSTILLEQYGPQLEENAGKALKVIQNNIDRMNALINDLLELSRLGSRSLHKHTFPMRQLIDTVMKDKEMDTKTTITIMPMEETTGDHGLLRQVWENLISNAIKFSSRAEHPVIEIGFSKTENEQLYWVKDNGVGFNPEYRHKLFKVFSRLHSVQEFPGTGAGLAIARKIIEAHGGKIWADAKPMAGAIFYFTLPV